MTVPTDPLYGSQAWLALLGTLGPISSTGTAGIERIWTDYRGQGVHVGVWDSGIEQSHWDLSANYDASRNVSVSGVGVNNGLPIISASTIAHGTFVAGTIAADNNGSGGVGVAFDASLTGITMLGGGSFDINTNYYNYLATLGSLRNFDVTNHSYGLSSVFDYFSSQDGIRVTHFNNSRINGRNGLGTINVAAAGNDNTYNGEDWMHNASVIVVAATTNTGQISDYSNYGCNILVSASGTVLSTDLIGSAGYAAGDTTTADGTSFASPTIAGLSALMLSANAGLGYRDVREILALSAMGAGSQTGGATTNENFAWRYNRANNWNGGGMHYSEDYGFGVANAYQAVRMAEVWSLFGSSHTAFNEITTSGHFTGLNLAIADLGTLNYDFTLNSTVMIENVALTVTLTHTYFRDLRMSLRSAEGTVISLYDGSGGSGSTSDGTWSFTFNITGLLGELASGSWRLAVTDAAALDVGTLQAVDITVSGRNAVNGLNIGDNVYHYTDEAVRMVTADSSRVALWDNNGGTDWLDFAAMSSSLNVNLATDGTGSARIWNGGVAGTTIATFGTGASWPYDNVMENAVTGDGNDILTGNSAANTLVGMRGNDTLNGGDGNDNLNGGAGADYLTGGYGWDTACYDLATAGVVVGLSGWTNYGEAAGDTFNGVEGIYATNYWDFLGGDANSNALYGRGGDDSLWGYGGADYLYGGDGNDILYGGAEGDYLEGGAGWDTARYDEAGAGVVAGLSGWTNYGEAAGDSYNSIEGVYASNYADYLGGDGNSNALYGRGGDDGLWGYGGTDYLYGGRGNDTLSGGAGSDVFQWSLGDGNDFITDFDVNSGDVIQLLGSGFTSFSQVQAAMSQTPGQNQTQINLGSATLYLWGVLPGQFTANDFAFA